MTNAEIAEYLRKHRNEFPQFTDAEIKIALKHLEEAEYYGKECGK